MHSFVTLIPAALVCVMAAPSLKAVTPEQKAEFMRQALAKSVSQKQKGLRWVAGGNHSEVLAAISDGAMFTDEMIQTVLADKDMHATLRKARFVRIVFTDHSKETRKAFLITQDGYQPTKFGGF